VVEYLAKKVAHAALKRPFMVALPKAYDLVLYRSIFSVFWAKLYLPDVCFKNRSVVFKYCFDDISNFDPKNV